MQDQCWVTVVDGCPTLTLHWVRPICHIRWRIYNTVVSHEEYAKIEITYSVPCSMKGNTCMILKYMFW